MRAAWLILLVSGLAAGCSGPAPDNVAAPAQPASNALAQIAALNQAQREMVLFRAIRDAGQECQDVTKSEQMPDQGGSAVWRVTCRGGGQWAVVIGTDGVANVTGPPRR